jgi:hypothetical protein
VGRGISSNDCSDYSGKVCEESTIYYIPAEVQCYRAITSHLRQISNMKHRYCAGFYVLGECPKMAVSRSLEQSVERLFWGFMQG